MKPKTRIQKEVAKLIRRLPDLTEKQTAYAFEHCFKHYAHRTKGGILTCTECGYRWKSEHPLAESVCGCTCPHCGKKLEVLDTRKRVFKDMEYFSIITTYKQFQVIRFFAVHTERKVCQPAKYSISEVVQRWIAPTARRRPSQGCDVRAFSIATYGTNVAVWKSAVTRRSEHTTLPLSAPTRP